MVEFVSKTNVCKVDESLGLVFGYAMVCKIGGEDHFDTQGDHIPEDTMLKVLKKFMDRDDFAGDMHTRDAEGNPVREGKILFAFPMTTDIAKALGITVQQTGAIIAMKPDSPEILAKFVSGERTGFSIGGSNPVYEDAT